MTNDLVYDPFSGKIYASLPGNSLLSIDPATGVSSRAVLVGNGPGPLAVSDDGSALYVALNGAAAVRRVELPAMTPGIQLNLGSDPSYGPYSVEDIEVQPGNPRVIAVSRVRPAVLPRHGGVAVFDNGVQRARTTQSHTGSNRIEFSSNPSVLYGLDNESSSSGFRRITVDASGARETQVTRNLIGGSEIEFHAGRIYSTSGVAIDPEALRVLGTYPGGFSNDVVADSQANRVYFLTSTGLRIHNLTTFAAIQTIPIPGIVGTPGSLVQWGDGALAFRTTGGQVFFVDLDPPDADDDRVGDAVDNCPDLANADQANRDGDRLGDACDPIPDAALRVRPVSGDFAFVGESMRVTYRLEDRRDGRLLAELHGVRLTLTLDGAGAVFGPVAHQGVLLAGGGTNRAFVEFVDGLVTLDVQAPVAGGVALAGQDSEGIDIEVRSEVFEDFETSDGGFTHSGANDSWALGTPTSGPNRAFSGVRAWGTNLGWGYPSNSDARLLSPVWRIPANSRPLLRFQSWFSADQFGAAGFVEVSSNDGATWTTLDTLQAYLGGYELRTYDVSLYAGQDVRVRFRFTSNARLSAYYPPGWYLDDVALLGIGRVIEFLAPDGDVDADGRTNAQELALGTHPHSADTDADAVSDGSDNCPLTSNGDQADAVHPNGIGDACEDPDGDLVFDLADDCPDATDTDQFNVDGDPLGDACDAYPEAALRVAPSANDFALLGESVRVTYRLEDRRDGRLLAELHGVRLTLTLDGAGAVFGPTAQQGVLLAGGGTNRAFVEFVDGLVTLDVQGPVAAVVALAGEDSEGIDIEVRSEVFEDFETSDGGFTHSGANDSWAHGTPLSGPDRAFSGVRVWATNLAGGYPRDSDASLLSPLFELPIASRPVLQFQSWFEAQNTLDQGLLELSDDNGASWTSLETFRALQSSWALKSYDLSAHAGKHVRVRFHFTSRSTGIYAGWYLDDFALSGLREVVEFLTPGGDEDHDGLSNVQELALGTHPRRADTDTDAVGDGSDNCPLASNTAQADAVHPNGVGDACDDPDGDLVFDVADNCPDLENADQANPDGDAFGEACDAYPDAALRVRPTAVDFALAGGSVRVTYRLEDRRDGRLLTELDGVRLTLTLGGAGLFGPTAHQGLLLEGGGTSRALVEFVDGLVTLDVQAPLPQLVVLGGDDSEGLDAEVPSDVFEDFETSDGGFTHSGTNDSWQLGAPTSGPGRAFSGARAWATNLAGNYPNGSDARLSSPRFRLPTNSRPLLQFRSWFDAESCCDAGIVEISSDDGASWSRLETLGGQLGGYTLKSYDLSADAGSEIRVRFRFTSDSSVVRPGWYLDDFALSDIAQRIVFLAPGGDEDQDALTNAEELALGTHPRRADTDDDAVADGSDNCPLASNGAQTDAVHPNGIGDACDDPDGDLVFDLADNCPDVTNPDQSDGVHPNGTGDACDDPDADGVTDDRDNCSGTGNPAQTDGDVDGLGDECDICPASFNPEQSESVACIAVSGDGGRCVQAEIETVEPVGVGEVTVSSTERLTPSSIHFEILATSCAATDDIEIFLNGFQLRTATLDPARTCSCSTPIQSLVIDDAALLARTWQLAGDNELVVVKTAPTSGPGSAVAWIRAELDAEGASESWCVFDVGGGDCSGTSLCAAGYSFAPIHQELALAEPFTRRTLLRQVPYSSILPGSFDIGAFADGDYELCVTGEKAPFLVGSSEDGELFSVNPTTGTGTSIGRLPSGATEIEYDDATGRGFVQDRDGSFSGFSFDVRNGSALGPRIFDGLSFNGLEYVGQLLYGTAISGPRGPSTLRILSPSTGASTAVGATGRGPISGLAYDASGDVLYGIDGGPGAAQLVSIDRTTGRATAIGVTGFQAGSLEFGPDGRLYAGSTGGAGGRLYRIDPDTGASELVGPTGFDSVTGLALVRSLSATDCRAFSKRGQEGMAINGAPCVAIQVGDRNGHRSINPSSGAVVQVSILGSGELDVRDVDQGTLTFGPGGAAPLGEPRGSTHDVDGDGLADLTCHYRIPETGIGYRDSRACLGGETLDGRSFESCGGLSIVPRPRASGRRGLQ